MNEYETATSPSPKNLNTLSRTRKVLIMSLVGLGSITLASGCNDESSSPGKSHEGTTIDPIENPTTGEPESGEVIATSDETYYPSVEAVEIPSDAAAIIEVADRSELPVYTENYLLDYTRAEIKIMQALEEEANGIHTSEPEADGIIFSTLEDSKETTYEPRMDITYIDAIENDPEADYESGMPGFIIVHSSVGEEEFAIRFEVDSSREVQNLSDITAILDDPETEVTLYSLEVKNGMDVYNEEGVLSGYHESGDTTEGVDASSVASSVGKAGNTLAKVRDYLAYPDRERGWEELTNKEKYHAAGVDLILDMARKLNESEGAETMELEEMYEMYGYGGAAGEGFSITLAQHGSTLRPTTKTPETTHTPCDELHDQELIIEKVDEGATCIIPEETTTLMFTYDQNEGYIDASAFITNNDNHTQKLMLATRAEFSKDSSVAQSKDLAGIIKSIEKNRGEDMEIDRLSAPISGMTMDYYDFFLDENGNLDSDHDAPTEYTTEEQMQGMLSRLGHYKWEAYHLGEEGEPHGID